MDVLVAGKGFIGSKVGEELEKRGHEVKYLDRSDADYEFDVTESFEIDEEFDVLVHTIGLAPGFFTEEQYREVHVEGTRNLLDAVECRKVVYLSALGVGKVDHSFFRTKEEAEQLVKESGEYAIIRPSTVYGESNKLLEMMRSLSFTRVFPNIKTRTQPIRLGDLARVVAEATERYENETLDAAGKKVYTLGELGRELYREDGHRCLLIPAPKFLFKLAIVVLSFLPPPFQRENTALLDQDNTTEENDAERMVKLDCFSG